MLLVLVTNVVQAVAGCVYDIGTTKKALKKCGEPSKKEINGPYEIWYYGYKDNIYDELEIKYGKVTKIIRWAVDSRGKPRIVEIR